MSSNGSSANGSSDRTPLNSFLIAAAATSCACVFTNPMETIKSRFQLLGELSSTTTSPYRGVFHAFGRIAREEGWRGLQAGLVPGIFYQSAMNGTRLSLYGHLQTFFHAEPNTDFFFAKNVIAGAVAGGCGAATGSPFFLVKARLQGQSSVHKIRSEGAEVFHYTGTFDAFRTIYREEGIKGLFRGVNAAVPRVMVGSAAQLSSYSQCKAIVLSTGMFDDGVPAYVASSLVSGLCVTTCMNPFDVVSTRLYNQSSSHIAYTGMIDCFRKTVKAEGVRGLYKGWTAHYLRLGPHTVLTFTFLETFQRLASEEGF